MTDTTGIAGARKNLHIARRDGTHGAGRVVLVHGSMDTSASFSTLDDLLADVEVTRYDRRGYGNSYSRGVPGLSIAGHVNDLLAVLDERPAVVVGHSLGGVVTLAAAARAPDLVRAALVYEVPMPWLPGWPPVVLPDPGACPEEEAAAAEAFLRRHMGDARWERLPERARAQLLSWAPAWAAELRSATHDPPFDPGIVGVPVLSVHGTATDERHAGAAKYLAENIIGARLARIPDGDHVAHRRLPHEFAGLVRSLISVHPT